MLILSLKKIADGLSMDKNKKKLAIRLYDEINYPLSSIECRKKLIS